MQFKPKFLATAIGSMPFTDPEHAVDVSLSSLTDAPIWPQLPRLGFKEHFTPQYCEGMPSIVVDENEKRIFFDLSGDYSEALAEFSKSFKTA